MFAFVLTFFARSAKIRATLPLNAQISQALFVFDAREITERKIALIFVNFASQQITALKTALMSFVPTVLANITLNVAQTHTAALASLKVI